ncbi:hypothetical protein [Yoonia sediminilitoris]|uniref:Uncharacterized protein n=1 Tax=Yoonia sediminilitoris TaxID=1286148 RepID=A0A2T6K9C2_9RHOB|nr:hypothetical protein [Yoonia sediminilitoris]PUB11320.1 hypothetical protein C8N45_11495 [Yoonia sediminilitoris]RCW91136.1 hypothetical protein DFP92_11495 [Yoonia sediminilitoris]
MLETNIPTYFIIIMLIVFAFTGWIVGKQVGYDKGYDEAKNIIPEGYEKK